MSNGARPAEEVQADPPRTLSKPEQELQSVLDEVLKKNKACPRNRAGPGLRPDDELPSSFAIQTVERLDVKEACPALVHTYLSVNEQVRNSPEYQEVAQAVQILAMFQPTSSSSE